MGALAEAYHISKQYLWRRGSVVAALLALPSADGPGLDTDALFTWPLPLPAPAELPRVNSGIGPMKLWFVLFCVCWSCMVLVLMLFLLVLFWCICQFWLSVAKFVNQSDVIRGAVRIGGRWWFYAVYVFFLGFEVRVIFRKRKRDKKGREKRENRLENLVCISIHRSSWWLISFLPLKNQNGNIRNLGNC